MTDYYHATSPEAAESIRQHGLKTCHTWDTEGRYWQSSGGNLGCGIYITSDPQVALQFGTVLLRVSLLPGTRVINVAEPHDPKTITYLKREFSKEILKCNPDRVMPKNKQLTEREYVELLKYHYSRTDKLIWGKNCIEMNRKRYDRNWKHVDLMHLLGKRLVRFGIHGWGEADDENGIVVFDGERVRLQG